MAGEVPERKVLKGALRAAGLSVRQVDALLRGGWRELVGVARGDADELRERLERLEQLVTVETDSPRA